MCKQLVVDIIHKRQSGLISDRYLYWTKRNFLSTSLRMSDNLKEKIIGLNRDCMCRQVTQMCIVWYWNCLPNHSVPFLLETIRITKRERNSTTYIVTTIPKVKMRREFLSFWRSDLLTDACWTAMLFICRNAVRCILKLQKTRMKTLGAIMRKNPICLIREYSSGRNLPPTAIAEANEQAITAAT